MVVEYVEDSFEDGRVDETKWKDKQIKPHQIAFSSGAAHGQKAIVITTVAADGGISCGDNPCQRAELRLQGNLRPNYGEEVWYGFSFKVSGDIQPVGSNRTVIGQWKGPEDDSPFLAQRFDNGVFHITIQDRNRRICVASAEGDPDRLAEFQNTVASLSADPALGPAGVRAARALADLRHFERFRPEGATEPGHAEHMKTLRAAAGDLAAAPVDSIETLFDEFGFIQDLECYAQPADLRLTAPAGPKKLPDPKADWVDMIYRIKGGRTDNPHGPDHQGEIDIWANGEFVAEVRGNMGPILTEPPGARSMYFKFGMYRNPLPNTILFHFDRFRQGRSMAEVEAVGG